MALNLDAAHNQSDPPGYVIQHKEDNGEVVALILIRLVDRKVVGEFTSRKELDLAALADSKTPKMLPVD